MKRIAVASDLSKRSARALARAVELAQRFCAALVGPPCRRRGLARRRSQARGERRAGRARRRSRLDGTTLRRSPDERVLRVPVLTAAINELSPDLLVIGTRGATGLDRVLMGSVAEALLRRVEIDVFPVPPNA